MTLWEQALPYPCPSCRVLPGQKCVGYTGIYATDPDPPELAEPHTTRRPGRAAVLAAITKQQQANPCHCACGPCLDGDCANCEHCPPLAHP
jgi:hypothetical protein